MKKMMMYQPGPASMNNTKMSDWEWKFHQISKK